MRLPHRSWPRNWAPIHAAARDGPSFAEGARAGCRRPSRGLEQRRVRTSLPRRRCTARVAHLRQRRCMAPGSAVRSRRHGHRGSIRTAWVSGINARAGPHHTRVAEITRLGDGARSGAKPHGPGRHGRLILTCTGPLAKPPRRAGAGAAPTTRTGPGRTGPLPKASPALAKCRRWPTNSASTCRSPGGQGHPLRWWSADRAVEQLLGWDPKLESV